MICVILPFSIFSTGFSICGMYGEKEAKKYFHVKCFPPIPCAPCGLSDGGIALFLGRKVKKKPTFLP